MNEDSQLNKIRRALERGEKLTGLEIIQKFGCLNYKGQISVLRLTYGLPIKTEMISVGKKKKKVALYSMPKPGVQTAINFTMPA